jgi:hypothetical protein
MHPASVHHSVPSGASSDMLGIIQAFAKSPVVEFGHDILPTRKLPSALCFFCKHSITPFNHLAHAIDWHNLLALQFMLAHMRLQISMRSIEVASSG